MNRKRAALRGLAVSAIVVAGTAVSGLTGGGVLASTGQIDYGCSVFGSTTFDYAATVTVTAPASANVGDEVTITADLSNMPGAAPVPVDSWSTTGTALLSGAQTGQFTVSGPTHNGPLAPKAPVPLGKVTGKVTLTTAGAVNVTLGDILVTGVAFGSSVPIPCSPKTAAPTLATINVGGGTGGGPTASVDPASVKQGGAITVAGTGWQSGAVDLALCDANGADCKPADLTDVTATADYAGKLTGSAKVGADATPGARTLVFTQGAVSKSAALTVTADVPPPTGACADKPAAQCGEQTLKLTVNGGPLTMSQQPGEVTLTPITLNGTEQSATGNLKQVKVVDARGGMTGWSLTGVLTDFTSTGGTKIPAGNLSWQPQCTAVGDSSPVTPGSAGALDDTTAATLCSGAGGTGGIVGGSYDADAGLNLKVPPVTGVGEYTAVLTLTLS